VKKRIRANFQVFITGVIRDWYLIGLCIWVFAGIRLAFLQEHGWQAAGQWHYVRSALSLDASMALLICLPVYPATLWILLGGPPALAETLRRVILCGQTVVSVVVGGLTIGLLPGYDSQERLWRALFAEGVLWQTLRRVYDQQGWWPYAAFAVWFLLIMALLLLAWRLGIARMEKWPRRQLYAVTLFFVILVSGLTWNMDTQHEPCGVPGLLAPNCHLVAVQQFLTWLAN
jgi:hypothetical protein